MAYTLFRTDPCNAYTRLENAVNEISESLNTLRELDRRLDDFKEKRLGAEDSISTTSIDRLITELRESYTS